MSNAQETKEIRLIEYIRRVAELGTKLVKDVNEYEQVLWLSDIPQQKGCYTQAWGRSEDYDPDIWIEVQARKEPELPAIPERCKDWVDLSKLKQKESLPVLLQEKTTIESRQDIFDKKTDRLENQPEIKKIWDKYIKEQWSPWVEKHNEWEVVQKVYSELFAIYQAQLRLGEAYELVLGLGLLTWRTPSGQHVRRHVIAANATLDFESGLKKFVVRPHPDGAKLRLELDMLDVNEQPVNINKIANDLLEHAGDDPWENGCIEGILKDLVHSINSTGEYNNTLQKKDIRASEKPVIEYAPALILRKRSANSFTDALNQIAKQIEKGHEIPLEFADLAEIEVKAKIELEDEQEAGSKLFDTEIFFPKPSNEAQRSIVHKMRSSRGVLVQGPPGTGKSHTIANLICHLLATGQRILVTAKTSRALQVLEGLIPPELRPLCINLLGSGSEERRSLESSVSGILRKNEEWNENYAKQKCKELEKHLQKLREEQAKIVRRLREIREAETHSFSIAEGEYQGTAARIAEAVTRDRAKYGWFSDKVLPHQDCSLLSATELKYLLDELRYFGDKKREELKLLWPEQLPSIEFFAELIQKKKNAYEEARFLANESKVDERLIDLLSKNSPEAIDQMRVAFSNFSDARRRLTSSSYPWMTNALRDILCGNSALWKQIAVVTRNVTEKIERLVEVADSKKIKIPDGFDIELLFENVCKLKEHIENGGKMGWGPFRPKTVKACLKAIKGVQVGGHPPSTLEDFTVLSDALQVRLECEKAWNFWKGQADKIHGPYAKQLTVLKSMCSTLEDVLSLENLIEKCRNAIRTCTVINEPDWFDESQINTLIYCFRLAHAWSQKRSVAQKIRSIEESISSIAFRGKVHPVTNELLNAIRESDLDRYKKALSKIQELTEDRLRLQEVDKCISKLRNLLPNLADELQRTCNESYWNERLQHIDKAWRWAQARYWIEEYIRKEDAIALDKRLKQIEEEIFATIAKLASLHAWSFCFSRLNEDHRRHMEAWKQSMLRLGKGTGKHAHRHRREAQRHLNECRKAVPAWVMPLHRVWDTVSPTPGMFDVVIVDEASQCGIEALPLFYLAKKIVIVGDDKQISPEAVGLPRDAISRLMEEYLFDFRFKSSFDVESSLFDHGKLRYGTLRITLREHFRCMPEIIRFSNDLCYADTPLIPLRQYGPDRLPPLQHVFVEGGYREGSHSRAINRPEAQAIVDKIVELCSDERYAGKTMGVVTLQGDEQAKLITSLLLNQLGPQEMERRRLICGNPYSFQGDERDVIFLSMVVAPNERIGVLSKAADERRFNVAASRARDQMWLFHSVQLEDLSDKDLRKRLLEFFLNFKPQQIAGIDKDELERRAIQDNRRIVRPPAPFESWFEVDVAMELLRKGFFVTPQFEVAGKRIDLVVEGGVSRLAVECDGDYWHGADRYEEDMQRQRQLERCGWEFFRVRESAFYADKDVALQGLWLMLEERGIYPRGCDG